MEINYFTCIHKYVILVLQTDSLLMRRVMMTLRTLRTSGLSQWHQRIMSSLVLLVLDADWPVIQYQGLPTTLNRQQAWAVGWKAYRWELCVNCPHRSTTQILELRALQSKWIKASIVGAISEINLFCAPIHMILPGCEGVVFVINILMHLPFQKVIEL